MISWNIDIFSSWSGFVQASYTKIYQLIAGYVRRVNFDGNVLAFQGVAAEPYGAKASMAQLVEDVIAGSRFLTAQAIT